MFRINVDGRSLYLLHNEYFLYIMIREALAKISGTGVNRRVTNETIILADCNIVSGANNKLRLGYNNSRFLLWKYQIFHFVNYNKNMNSKRLTIL